MDTAPHALASLLNNVLSVVGPTPAFWSLSCIVLFFLGLSAAIDAQTRRIPDSLLLPGAVIAIFGGLILRGSLFVFERVALAGGIAALLWGLNELYYKLRHRDGFGFGDTKWTALAILAFGIEPALIAWLAGAWLALVWLALVWIFQKAQTKGAVTPIVPFAPFLFFGLLIGIAV